MVYAPPAGYINFAGLKSDYYIRENEDDICRHIIVISLINMLNFANQIL